MTTRTDTVLIPRVISTASAPLAPRRRPRATAVAALVVFALGIALAVIAGQALAYRGAEPPVGDPAPRVLDLELPYYSGTGTDAGLITTPAGDQ